MILVITTEGVRIPEDVHKVHLTVQIASRSLDDTVYDADVELCNPTLTTGCYDIPVTAALFPGKSRGSDSVRVQVDAIGGNGTVIADAALFTFAKEQSLRLDFVLYANCLGNVECAERDQACGPLDTCIDLKPGQTNGPLDLALPHVEDMSMPATGRHDAGRSRGRRLDDGAAGSASQRSTWPAAPTSRATWASSAWPASASRAAATATPAARSRRTNRDHVQRRRTWRATAASACICGGDGQLCCPMVPTLPVARHVHGGHLPDAADHGHDDARQRHVADGERHGPQRSARYV